ncbi:MAG TPA: rod shape-determining protein MreC [Bdellovibrionota bacterium]|nr:rod shape-determining protein MreC [Bdellovibrionota bacterium]
MLRYLLAYRRIIIILLLIIFPIIILSTLKNKKAEQAWYDRMFLAITSPIQKGVNTIIRKSVSLVDDYLLLAGVQKENENLKTEIQTLKQQIATLHEAENENERFRKLLLFKEKVGTFMVPAEVIATDPLQAFQTLKINKGSLDGITNGKPVVTAEGVVGQIVRIYPRFSDVLLLSDPSSSIDVLLQRTRVRGVLEGKGGSVAAIKYLRRVDDVQLGDAVITSGLGGKFPKGILIGTVTKVSKEKYGITQNVEVQPSVDFGRLEEVFVVLRIGEEPKEELKENPQTEAKTP